MFLEQEIDNNPDMQPHMQLLGKDGVSKTDEFSEKFQKGAGGVIFNPQIYIADFGPLNRAFSA